MNVAVVVLDTLRKDAFDERFGWLPGKRFENAWATSNWTVPSHASLFTGKYASEVGVYAKANTLDCEEPTLAERLSDAGYTTRAFSANPNVSKRFDFDRGFDIFEGSWRVQQFQQDLYDWESFVQEAGERGPTRYLEAVWRCLRDDCATIPSLKQGFELVFRPQQALDSGPDDGAQAILETVRENGYGDREFLFLNLMEAHGPYEAPEGYAGPSVETPSTVDAIAGDDPADPEAVREAYDACVRYLSEVYERIFAELREDFDYVITLSDHGELLGEHGLWDHQHGLHPELTHVPLVVSGDGLDGTAETPVSLLDVHRTVLELADINGDSRGRDLLDDPAPEPVLTEYHGFTTWVLDALEERGVDQHTRERYDEPRNGIVSPPTYYGYETVDGWTERGTATDDDPRETMGERRSALETVRPGGREAELSDAARDRLEELGYA